MGLNASGTSRGTNGRSWQPTQLPLVDDAALVADLEKLSRLLSKFGIVCARWKLKDYEGKS